MMDEILISFIVPVYNAEKTIPKCLDSILNQTERNFEIIVVNDGSTDNVQSIINQYVENYPSVIKAYTKPNAGPGDTRNYGIEKSTGKYLAFVDSDDSIKPNYTSVVTAIINEHNADMVILNYNRIYNKKQNIIERIYKFSEWSLFNSPVNINSMPEIIGMLEVAVWLRVIKKNILIDNNLLFTKHLKISEDLEASLKWYVSAKKIVVSSDKLYNYIITNNTLNFSSNNIEQFNEVIKGVYTHYKNNNLIEKCQHELEYILTKHILVSNMLRLRDSKRVDKFEVFMLLRNSLIYYFPNYTKNKYLKREPFYLKILVFFSNKYPGLFRFIL